MVAGRASRPVREQGIGGWGREYRRYLETLHTSLKEVGTALRIAHGSEYIAEDRFKQLMALLDETSRTLFGLMRSVSLRIERGEKNR